MFMLSEKEDLKEPLSVSDQKRKAIIQAAIGEFKKFGYLGSSVDKVAAVASVSKRTVYNHFKSKSELFDAILAEARTQMDQTMKVAFDPNEDLKLQLTELGYAVAKQTMNKQFIKIARIIISKFIHTPEESRSITDEDIMIAAVEEWISEACEQELISVEDTTYAAIEFMGLIKTFAFWPQLYGRKNILKDAELADVVIKSADMFLARYKI